MYLEITEFLNFTKTIVLRSDAVRNAICQIRIQFRYILQALLYYFCVFVL
jgi:hypothetical protein